jgi:HEAT repeat protein
LGAAAVLPLADAMASTDKGVSRAATEALERVTHHAARPGAGKSEAARVAAELLKVASSKRPATVRKEALNQLGFVGTNRDVAPLARLLGDIEVRDDARMALERIPGPQSLRALQEALGRAPADLQPGLRQSIWSRTQTRATLGAMRMQ